MLPRTSQTAPRITTASTKKKRRVIVIGDSLLRGTEGPICRPDPSHREVCCLPGARVRDVAKKLPGLVWPSQKSWICVPVGTALKTCFPLISALRHVICHLQSHVLQTFSLKLQRSFLLQMESTETLPLALSKRHGAVYGYLTSPSRLMLMKWCLSLRFRFPARAGIQSAFPQSHTQWISVSYMLRLALRWSEFLQTVGLLATEWVRDKGQPCHSPSLLSLEPQVMRVKGK